MPKFIQLAEHAFNPFAEMEKLLFRKLKAASEKFRKIQSMLSILLRAVINKRRWKRGQRN